MKNKRKKITIIAIIIVIIVVTIGLTSWMFMKKTQAPIQQVVQNKPVSQTQEAKPQETDEQKQVQESNIETSSTWDGYKKTTLNQIILEEKSHLDSSDKVGTYVYNATSLTNPYSVNLIYKDKYRKILPQTKQFLTMWAKSLSIDSKNIALYEEEVLFVESNGNEHWMPIQKQLVSYLKKEATSDDYVNLAIMWAGTYKKSTGYNWVFLINEFNAQQK